MCDWKEVTAHMIAKAGSREEVAKLLGVSEPTLSNWCNPDHPSFIPVNRLVMLNALTNDVFLKKLARERGFEMTKREKPLQTANIFHVIGRFSAACGHLAFVVLQAAADKIYSRNEQRKIHIAMRPVKDELDEIESVVAR